MRKSIVAALLISAVAPGCFGLAKKIDSAAENARIVIDINTAERRTIHIDYLQEGTLLVYHSARLVGKAEDVEALFGILKELDVSSFGQLSLSAGPAIGKALIARLVKDLCTLGLAA